MAMTEISPPIRVEGERRGEVSALTVSGVLDSATYRGLRDAIIKAALDEPRAVIVDVNKLSVPSASAWAVFTSARWHVSTWPDVPVLLVCGNQWSRRTIAAAGVTRYVPVYPSYEAALDAVRGQSLQIRRRARADLRPPGTASAVPARCSPTGSRSGRRVS